MKTVLNVALALKSANMAYIKKKQAGRTSFSLMAVLRDAEAARNYALPMPSIMWEIQVKNPFVDPDAAVTATVIVNKRGGELMKIKILGTGCSSCRKLEEHVREAVKEMGIDAEIEKVEDMMAIMAYGVMQTPALVVDEKVKIMGRVPSTEDIKKYL